MFRDLIIRSLGNRLDWKTSRKLLVFESDDWGSLSLPNEAYTHRLERSGILSPNRAGYKRFDCLESRADLQSLFDVLSQFTDTHGNPAKITFNTVMGNPDFKKIQQSDFREYAFQHFFDSYVEHNGEDCRDLWADGMAARLFWPQFHAREHLNVPRWMGDLRSGRDDTRIAFDNNFYCLTRSTSSPVDYLTAYWPDSPEDLRRIQEIAVEGLELFEKTFGVKSDSFVACCFVLPEELERLTASHGVRLIQTQRRYRAPVAERNHSQFRTRYSGQKNQWGQIFSVRNIIFEPALDESIDCAQLALNQIIEAFEKNVPAVVSSHRVNFVGGRILQNRERTLRMLSHILREVTRAFPDVEFLSSNELLSAFKFK